MAQAAEKIVETENMRGFDAEVSSVLHLMIHALYTNRDIFLRELISNASDACDKLRFESLSNAELAKEQSELGIRIQFDKKAGIIEIEDNGIGMNEADLVANLGTIARSGTKEFLENAASQTKDGKVSAELIGQFGVGFYSAFMVADSVEVHTRKAGEAQSWQWQSDGKTGYTISEGEDRACGTSIRLHVKDDAKEYLDVHRLTHIVKTYSDHVSFPITLVDEEGEDRRVNDASAIWARPKQDITTEQYQEFYHHVAQSPEEPWMVLHNKNEGALEFTNLLFIPGSKPFDLFQPERRKRVKLYVKRVFIADEDVDLIPGYMRFLRGVIDSSDLPLNISRETLQKNPVMTKIREKVTSKVLSELKKKSEKDPEGYQKFWENFGAALKEGLCEGNEPRAKILDACRFYSTHDEEKTITLKDYVSRMKDEQKDIYFLTGDSLAALRNSPQLEGFKARGVEVLLLDDHVDDFWTNVTLDYDGKNFTSVLRSGDALDKLGDAEEDASEAKTPENEAAIDALIAGMKTTFGEEVSDVRVTKKLAESPCCLAVNDGAMDIRMERFLMEHNQLPQSMPKILEINPSHALITKLAEAFKTQGLENSLTDKFWLLLDQARLSEGESLTDMSAFIKRLNAQLLND